MKSFGRKRKAYLDRTCRVQAGQQIGLVTLPKLMGYVTDGSIWR